MIGKRNLHVGQVANLRPIVNRPLDAATDGEGRLPTGRRLATCPTWAVLAMLSLAGCSSVQRDPPLQVWWDMKWQDKFEPQLSIDVLDHHDQLAKMFPDH